MKKIGDLFQGQVPPNQTPSTASDEKAAIKGDASARHPQQPQPIDPAEAEWLRAITEAKKAELDAEVAKAKATAPEPTQAEWRQWYLDYHRRISNRNQKPMPTTELMGRMEAMAPKSKSNETETAETAPTKTVVQLPLWPDAVRALPNGFLRSAMFSAIRKGRRRYLKAAQLAALDGIEIRYTGERLDQGDLDVYEGILHVARQQALGSKCHATSYALLKLIGKTDTGKNRAILQTRIERLRANALTVKQGRYSYIGGLIDEAYKDEETQQWVIVLNPKLAALFAPDQFTQVEWAVRHALDGRQLAQWLHGFYASHADPYPIKVETVRRLCGSENKELKGFRRDLRQALAELAAVTGWAWRIDKKDLVHIEKTPTPSQARHLIRRRGRPKKPR